jgi:hypothetical protein
MIHPDYLLLGVGNRRNLTIYLDELPEHAILTVQ